MNKEFTDRTVYCGVLVESGENATQRLLLRRGFYFIKKPGCVTARLLWPVSTCTFETYITNVTFLVCPLFSNDGLNEKKKKSYQLRQMTLRFMTEFHNYKHL